MNEAPSSRVEVRKVMSPQGGARPVLDLGSTPNTTLTRTAHERLRVHLGLKTANSPRLMSRSFQAVRPDEAILEQLHIDTRAVFPSEEALESLLRESHDGTYKDEWGIRYRPATVRGELLYYEISESPLARAETPRDVCSFSWPEPSADVYEGLAQEARHLAQHTPYALVGHPGDTSLFEVAFAVLGAQRFLMALVCEQDLVHSLMECVTAVQIERMSQFLDAVGESLDVISIGDDLGQQGGLLLSPACYRSLIKPFHRDFLASIKKKTSAKVMMHSCGGISPLISDLVEIGVDAINPVQVTARGMEPDTLADRFGGTLTFWGGVDTQDLMPRGEPDDVRTEVRRLVRILGEHGRFVLGPVHNIQPDVPPENILALYEEGRRCVGEGSSASGTADEGRN